MASHLHQCYRGNSLPRCVAWNCELTHTPPVARPETWRKTTFFMEFIPDKSYLADSRSGVVPICAGRSESWIVYIRVSPKEGRQSNDRRTWSLGIFSIRILSYYWVTSPLSWPTFINELGGENTRQKFSLLVFTVDPAVLHDLRSLGLDLQFRYHGIAVGRI